MKEFALALPCQDCIPLHVADEAAARAGADHALGYEPVSERFVMVSVSLIGEADASFARFAPVNAGSVWEPRRSREMTHLCSFKVTHTKNTICLRARISAAISSTPQACGAG